MAKEKQMRTKIILGWLTISFGLLFAITGLALLVSAQWVDRPSEICTGPTNKTECHSPPATKDKLINTGAIGIIAGGVMIGGGFSIRHDWSW